MVKLYTKVFADLLGFGDTYKKIKRVVNLSK